MRNKYKGVCYRCGKIVEVGEGFFERHNKSWRVQHIECANKHKTENKENICKTYDVQNAEQ